MGQPYSNQLGITPNIPFGEGDSILSSFDARAYSGAEMQYISIPSSGNFSSQDLFELILKTQEEERSRISESLHNSFAQLLYAIQLQLANINKEELSSGNRQTASKIETLLHEAIETTRTVAFELTPHVLKLHGLKITLQDLCQKLSNQKLTLHSDVHLTFKPESIFETSLFRIIQELINNIIKHSNASEGWITVIEKDKIITITIKDNGKGFDTDYPSNKPTGSGLSNIKQRITLLQGEFHIFSTPEKGTLAQIKIKAQ